MMYGYSQTTNVFCLLVCAYPNQSLQSFMIIYGAVHSSIFLFFAFNNEIGQTGGNSKYFIFTIMAAGQFVLILIYKYYFFGNLYAKKEYILRDTNLRVALN